MLDQKPCLVVVCNHRFDRNLDVLERFYPHQLALSKPTTGLRTAYGPHPRATPLRRSSKRSWDGSAKATREDGLTIVATTHINPITNLITFILTLAVPLLSIVSPVYGAEKLVDELVRRIQVSVSILTEEYEIILVDDRGPDNSWSRIQANCARDPRVRGVRLSRNFGQHRAITAGLGQCRGEWVVVMDCDLQDQPEEIPRLYAHAQQGHDIVFARRVDRRDSWAKKFFSRTFYRVLSYLTETPQDPAIANFGIYHRKVVDAVLTMRESIRYFPTMVRWVGFRTDGLAVEHAERTEGSSSYNFSRLVHLALDIVLAYSDKPLRLTVKLGLLISAGAFLMVPITLIRYLTGHIWEPGYTSLIISIWFFSGLILSVLGMLGLYVGKTFEQVKNRPIYLIDERTDLTADSR